MAPAAARQHLPSRKTRTSRRTRQRPGSHSRKPTRSFIRPPAHQDEQQNLRGGSRLRHAAGTAAGEGVMSIAGQPSHLGLDLRFWSGAPGRIRTRDPLLRRQLLCPAELRALERNCVRRRSRDGYAKVAVCRLDAAPPRKTLAVSSPEDSQPQRVPQGAVNAELVKPGKLPNRITGCPSWPAQDRGPPRHNK